MSNNPYILETLDNGLRIVIEQMPDVRSAAAGFLVDTGARDEVAPQAGVSHFLEHMMFKGTSKRHWSDITTDFDKLGSTYNAYTSEDRTIYYGWVRQADLDAQIEILADMMTSILPEDEFHMERKVVLEEIAMSKDQIEHVAFDFLQEKVFEDHPLAWPILGYENTVNALSRDQMWAYFQQRYAPDNMMLVVAGNVDPDEAIKSIEQHCGQWRPSGTTSTRVPPQMKSGTDVLQMDRFKQQIVAITIPAAPAGGVQAEIASAIATILGGENSRFFWNIVQTGLSPRASAFHYEFSDSGLMLLYGSCQPENCKKLHDAMREEARRINDDGVEEHEVQRVRNRRRTSLAIEAEVPYHRLTQLMDDMQYLGQPRTVEQMLSEVDQITVDSVQKYMEKFPLSAAGHLVSVGPRDWPSND